MNIKFQIKGILVFFSGSENLRGGGNFPVPRPKLPPGVYSSPSPRGEKSPNSDPQTDNPHGDPLKKSPLTSLGPSTFNLGMYVFSST